MNFKELLKRYKEGKATEEEIEFIKGEIEKYEALEEYISGEIDFDKELNFDRDLNSFPREDKSLKDGARNIQKNVNKRLRKVVLTSVSIVVALYFIVFLVLSPLVDMFFYNPTKISVGKDVQDFYYDIDAITRLNMPGTIIHGASADKNQFGSYNLSINRKDLFQQKSEELNLKITRNMRYSFKFTEPANYNFPFILNGLSNDFAQKNNDLALSNIKELNPVSHTSSYIIFKEDLTMEELVTLREKYLNNNIQFIWAGIRTEDKTKEDKSDLTNAPVTGFSLAAESGGSPNGDFPDLKKYPAFDYMRWLTKQDYHENLPAEGYALHYKNLLQYLIDRKEASNTIEGTLKHDYYSDSLDYVEENGVKAFGLLIYADARDLLEFIQNEDIHSIQLNDVLPLRKNFGVY
nr:anti sigma factor C-terminal domain-containing protein [Tissierella sp.]